jgi:hypothetical protein
MLSVRVLVDDGASLLALLGYGGRHWRATLRARHAAGPCGASLRFGSA